MSMSYMVAEMMGYAHRLEIERSQQEYLEKLQTTAYAEVEACALTPAQKVAIKARIAHVDLLSSRAEGLLRAIRVEIGPVSKETSEKALAAAERAKKERSDAHKAHEASSCHRRMHI